MAEQTQTVERDTVTEEAVAAAHRVVVDRVSALVIERQDGSVDVQSVDNITPVRARTAPFQRVTKALAARLGMIQCPACSGLGMVPPRH